MGTRLEATEAENQDAILDYLSAWRIFAWRVNTGAQLITYFDHAGRKRTRMFRSHNLGKGTADMQALIPSRRILLGNKTTVYEADCATFVVLWIEVKKTRAGKQSDEQIAFADMVRSLGHYYLLARSVDDVEEWLKEHR